MSIINCKIRFAHVMNLACGQAGIPVTMEMARSYLAKKCDGKIEESINIVATFKQLATEWRGMVYSDSTVVYENDRVRAERLRREQEAAMQRKQKEIAEAEKIAADLAAAATAAVQKLQLLRAA